MTRFLPKIASFFLVFLMAATLMGSSAYAGKKAKKQMRYDRSGQSLSKSWKAQEKRRKELRAKRRQAHQQKLTQSQGARCKNKKGQAVACGGKSNRAKAVARSKSVVPPAQDGSPKSAAEGIVETSGAGKLNQRIKGDVPWTGQ